MKRWTEKGREAVAQFLLECHIHGHLLFDDDVYINDLLRDIKWEEEPYCRTISIWQDMAIGDTRKLPIYDEFIEDDDDPTMVSNMLIPISDILRSTISDNNVKDDDTKFSVEFNDGEYDVQRKFHIMTDNRYPRVTVLGDGSILIFGDMCHTSDDENETKNIIRSRFKDDPEKTTEAFDEWVGTTAVEDDTRPGIKDEIQPELKKKRISDW